MKFKFCGNMDCPEWIISEITLLTKISTIKLRIICNNLVNYFLNANKSYKDIIRTLEEMNFSEEESSIIISVLEFIIKHSSKFDVDDLILNGELQQLGLPQENADSISKVFKNNKDNLKKKMTNDVFTFNKIESLDYKINYILASNLSNYKTKGNEEEDSASFVEAKVDLNFNLSNGGQYHTSMSKEILGKFINDLERCAESIKKHKEN